MKLRTRLVKVIQGHGQVKFYLASIWPKLGEINWTCLEYETKERDRSRSSNVTVRSNFTTLLPKE